MQRYFVTEKKKDIFTLNEIDTYHLTKVMRADLATKVEIVYERSVYICSVISISPLQVKIIEKLEDKENECLVDIAQALVKEQKMDYILQKSTELGVKKIIPIKTERAVVKINDKQEKKVDRWNKVVQEASKQSKRLDFPIVTNVMSIKELSQLDYDYKVLCTVNEVSTNIKRVLEKTSISDRILFVIGPEGGFTPLEEKILLDNGFISVSIGSNVLRTETVSLFLLSVINYHFMR